MKSEDKDIRLTTSADEEDIDTVFGSDCIFLIPYFQRAYRWEKKHLEEYISDINQVLDGAEDLHFLGAIILYERPSPAGRSKKYEVVDGQQRLSTVALFLLALVKQFCSIEKHEEAADLFFRYITIGRKSRSEISNLKLHPSKEDRNQFNSIVKLVLQDDKLVKALDTLNISYLLPTGVAQGKLTKQFKEINKFLETEKKKGGYDRLDNIYQVVAKQFTCIQIILKDPTACSRIFERLNYRGEKVNIGDLVRNEIFSRVAEKQSQIDNVEALFTNMWEPFYEKFNPKTFELFFFPYGIIKKSSLKKNEIFNYLRILWDELDDTEKIISDLKRYQAPFLFLSRSISEIDVPKECLAFVKRLYDARIPSVTFPFLMQLLVAIQEKSVSIENGNETIDVIDSFLTRRAICGIEPTGLHSVFKSLWEDCQESPTAKKVEAQIKSYKTVSWPDDSALINAINKRALYGSNIINYILKEFDKHLGGDVPSDKPEIEHIMPQTYNKNWHQFTKTEHEDYKDTVGNLIPVSPGQNKKLGGKSYLEKREIYLIDSMYKTPREVAKNYNEWNPIELKLRNGEIFKWAVERWPHG